MKAVRIHRHGGPGVLRLEDVPVPEPAYGQVRVRVHVVGVNYIDVYHRTGIFPVSLPFTPGVEAAGIIDAVGPDVTGVSVGDRVVYAMELGSYATHHVVPAWKVVPVPPAVSLVDAAAAMLQGVTAHYLTTSTFPIEPGHRVLVHAAAGGVGFLLTQMAKRRGATVYATVSTPAKARIARAAGADEVILYTEEDFSEAIRRLTNGQGVHAVYDSVGKATFDRSLACLAPRGYLVLFGHSSGPVENVDPLILYRAGSVFLTRPGLLDYTADRAELLQRAGDVFSWIQQGRLQLRIDSTLPLERAAEAHIRLESRTTSGKLLLTV